MTVTERFAVVTAEATAIAFAVAAGTVAVGLAVAVTERLALTVTGTAETTAITFPITTRTITKRLTVTVTGTAETTAITFPITTRTIAIGLALTVAGTAAETTAITFPITTRTITKRLTVPVVERLTLPATGSSSAGEVVTLTVRPGPEPTRLTAGVVVAAERAAVVAAVATVVLGHMDSSCCEPTTGATAAARFVSYATRNQALRSPYIFINSSGAAKCRGTAEALGAASWPASQLNERPLTFGRFLPDARSCLAGSS
ncbi:hypothetical protein [Pseudarthrobacter defluvii]|uniref:hypothetical protein n=1 Tax=Pseudarthrobacter defluvii TaxID=410837 RepID=UPI0027D78661|nr:hypothetical protein [Pseudarthrobacter defluvii]